MNLLDIRNYHINAGYENGIFDVTIRPRGIRARIYIRDMQLPLMMENIDHIYIYTGANLGAICGLRVLMQLRASIITTVQCMKCTFTLVWPKMMCSACDRALLDRYQVAEHVFALVGAIMGVQDMIWVIREFLCAIL